MVDNFIINPPFNFSIETLKRINDYMREVNSAFAKGDVLKHLSALEVLYIETLGFWNEPQTNEVNLLIETVHNYDIEIMADCVSYPLPLLTALKELHIFIFKGLHKNGISYSSRDLHKGLDAQEKKYHLGGD